MPCFFQEFDKEGKPLLSGDSQFKDHVGWVVVTSWHSERPGSDGLRNSVTMTLAADEQALPSLFRDAATGRTPRAVTAKLECIRQVPDSDKSEIVTLAFEDPQFSQVALASTALPGGRPTLTLKFFRLKIVYRLGDAASNIRQAMPGGGLFPATWPADDLAARQAVA
jgi:hypothetical protein